MRSQVELIWAKNKTLSKTVNVLPVVWPLLAAAELLVLQSGPISCPFSPSTFMTFISTYFSWPCPDLTSVTFDMTLAIGVIVTPRVTAAILVTSLIRLVYSEVLLLYGPMHTPNLIK